MLHALHPQAAKTRPAAIFASPLDQIARVLVITGIIFIPISTSTNALIVVAVIITLLGGRLTEKLKLIMSYKTHWLTLLLMLLFLCGVFYNTVSIQLGVKEFGKYAGYFMIAMWLIPLFIDKTWQRRAMQALFAGAFIAAAISILRILPIQFFHSVFHKVLTEHDLQYSVYSAFIAFLLLHHLYACKTYLAALGIGALLIFFLFLLFFINQERTGMLVFLGLVLLATLQCYPFKGMLAACLGLGTLLIVLFLSSASFHLHVTTLVDDIKRYPTTHITSTGMRLYLAKYSMQHIKERPILGAGTGLYTKGIERWLKAKPAALRDEEITDAYINPENTFLHISLQLGILGLLVFIAWLGMQWLETNTLPTPQRYYNHGLIAAIVISSFCIVSFYPNHTSTLYATFLAIFLASRESVPLSDF
jgi:O-antigen ligase